MRSYLREELVQVILGHYDKICIKVYCALFSELDVAPHCILYAYTNKSVTSTHSFAHLKNRCITIYVRFYIDKGKQWFMQVIVNLLTIYNENSLFTYPLTHRRTQVSPLTEVQFCFKMGSSKKFSYDRRAYESVDKKNLS